jgi:hypothetical protein
MKAFHFGLLLKIPWTCRIGATQRKHKQCQTDGSLVAGRRWGGNRAVGVNKLDKILE